MRTNIIRNKLRSIKFLDFPKTYKHLRVLKRFSVSLQGRHLNSLDDQEIEHLLKCLKIAQADWLNANASFDWADNNDMIDYYTYIMKACEVNYNSLVRRAKEKGIKVPLIQNGCYKVQ